MSGSSAVRPKAYRINPNDVPFFARVGRRYAYHFMNFDHTWEGFQIQIARLIASRLIMPNSNLTVNKTDHIKKIFTTKQKLIETKASNYSRSFLIYYIAMNSLIPFKICKKIFTYKKSRCSVICVSLIIIMKRPSCDL